MKKQIAVMLSILILAGLISGCGAAKEPPAVSSEAASSVSESTPASSELSSSAVEATKEEAVENNNKIAEESINLVQFLDPAPGTPIATMTTSMGEIRIMFFPELAPKAVENFLTHAKDGYYNGLKFHRVIDGFMIQTGDPTGTGAGGNSIFKDKDGNPVEFDDEFSNNLWHFRGALSMAKPNRPNSNGSQFFIVQSKTVQPELLAQMAEVGFPQKVIDKYKEVGGTPGLDRIHSVFGMVISGMDVVDKIAAVETTGSPNDTPVEDVIISSITIEETK